MPEGFKRKLIFHVNKFQKLFFYPVIAAFLLGCIVSWFSLFYFYLLDAMIINGTLWNLIPLFLTLLAFLMFFVIMWTLQISNKMVGPYNRIIRELDEILAGKRETPLTARKGDKMFQELLERINKLIEGSGSFQPRNPERTTRNEE